MYTIITFSGSFGGTLLHILELFPFLYNMTGYHTFLIPSCMNCQIIRGNRSVKSTIINWSDLKMMLLWWIFWWFWNITCVSWWYITRNLTMMIRWLTDILNIWIRRGCMSTLSIWITVTILFRWMKWPLLIPTIIIGFTWSFLLTIIAFPNILGILIWFMVHKQTIFNLQSHIY